MNKVQQSYQTHTSGFFSSGIVVKKSYTYDHADRVLTVADKIGAQKEIIVAENAEPAHHNREHYGYPEPADHSK